MFKSIFDNSLAAIVVTDDQGNYSSVNKAASELFGYTGKELSGMNVGDLKTTAKHGAAKRFEEYISKGEEAGEFDFTTKKGVHKFVQYQAIRIKADFNLSIMMNITEQKLAEEAIRKNEDQLRRSKARLETGLNVASIALVEIDYETSMVSLSTEAAFMYGLSPDRLLITRQELHNTFHPDCKEQLVELIHQSLNPDGDGVLETEHSVLFSSGEVRWLKVSKQVFFDNARQLPLYSILAAQDITAKKQNEEKINQSEAKFRKLSETIPQMVWTATPDGGKNFFNKYYLDYTGLTSEELTGDGWHQTIFPDELERVLQQWDEIIKTGKDFKIEKRILHHDGTYAWHLSYAISQKDVAGNIIGWIGINTNIDEQKSFTEELATKVTERTEELAIRTVQLEEMNEALELKNTELENANTELNSFTYIASHDLQEPLRKIQAFSKRIIEAETLSSKSTDYFGRIIAAGERMQNLILALLDFSRADRAELVIVPCDLNTIVEESKNDLHLSIIEKNALIEYENLPVVNGRHVQLSQLFTNLIENAIKYSRSGVVPYIRITSERIHGNEIAHPAANKQRTYYAIKIADNGIGFEKEYATKIFELFQRLHGRNEYSGTGIGLAIVKKIATNHTGFIVAEGNPNLGSTFILYLPTQ